MDGDPVVEAAARDLGLPPGRMISWSKSGYRTRHPVHVPVFNASIAGDDRSRLWWGDLDLTLDEAKIVALAKALGRTIYVLFEGDARVEPLTIEAAIVTVAATGDVLVGSRTGLGRSAKGALVRGDR